MLALGSGFKNTLLNKVDPSLISRSCCLVDYLVMKQIITYVVSSIRRQHNVLVKNMNTGARLGEKSDLYGVM